MNAQELKEKRRVILLNLVTDSSLEARLDRIEASLQELDALDNKYIETLEAVIERKTHLIAMLQSKPSLFHDVMVASHAYVTRFPGGRLTEEGTVKKFDEEVDEFKETITELVVFNDEARSHFLEEFIDVMVTAGGIFAYYGVKWSEIEDAARDKLKKLNARTDESYAWHEGTETVMHKSKIAALVAKEES